MPTLEYPVFAVSGTLVFSVASRRKVRAALFGSPPAFRTIRRKCRAVTFHPLKHGELSRMIVACQWGCTRTCSSWSRL